MFVAQQRDGGVHGNLTDTFSNFHDYTVSISLFPVYSDDADGMAQIDWQQDQLNFLIDGQVVRTVQKSDTVVNGVSQYPTTPARFQLR